MRISSPCERGDSVAMFCVSSLCISAAIPHSAVRVVPGEVGD